MNRVLWWKHPRLLECWKCEREHMEEQGTALLAWLQFALQELGINQVHSKPSLSLCIKKWLLKQLFQILLHLQK